MVFIILIAIPLVFLFLARGYFHICGKINLKKEQIEVQFLIRESDQLFKDFFSNKQTEFTVLLENMKMFDRHLIQTSHGISIFVERKGKKFLLDVGNQNFYRQNARLLKKEIAEVDFVFISHGHMDHGGGLGDFMSHNNRAKIYLSENAIKKKYLVKRPLRKKRIISLDATLLDQFPDRFEFIKKTTEISEDIFIIPSIIKKFPTPVGNKSLLTYSAGNIVRDNFNHEQLLVIKDSDGLIVFSGCCHNGVLNVIHTVSQSIPDLHIKAVIGGFHLSNHHLVKIAEKPESLKNLAEKLLKFDVKLYITGHCTGVAAFKILKSIMAKRLAYFSTGIYFKL